jgi:hypothetical protein
MFFRARISRRLADADAGNYNHSIGYTVTDRTAGVGNADRVDGDGYRQ